MTNEERDLITRFIERVGGPAASGGFASVPATTPSAQNLPPVDREADALLAELFQKYPEARYRITQVAVNKVDRSNPDQKEEDCLDKFEEANHQQSAIVVLPDLTFPAYRTGFFDLDPTSHNR